MRVATAKDVAPGAWWVSFQPLPATTNGLFVYSRVLIRGRLPHSRAAAFPISAACLAMRRDKSRS
jgi:hypothetical protein